jgi:hypothetical protein
MIYDAIYKCSLSYTNEATGSSETLVPLTGSCRLLFKQFRPFPHRSFRVEDYIIITVLDIVHCPIFYLKYDVSETDSLSVFRLNLLSLAG